MHVDDHVKVSDPAVLERKFEQVKKDFERRMLAIEQHHKMSMDIDDAPKDKKTVDSSLDVDQNTGDDFTNVDHEQEVCDVEWYLY